jgi:LacI family transcriptional regulator
MITLKDLAQKLSVSVSTVSKALNDSPEISEGTSQRIKALAKYYNYQPNRMALSLKKNQTKTIGVVIPNILNRFFAKVLFGIQEEAIKLGYNIIVCLSNESIQKEKESLQLLSNGSVDGFILALSEETQLISEFDHFQELQEKNIPVVMFDRVLDKIECDKVIIDDKDATFKATQTLMERHRKKIAFVSNIDNLNVGKLREVGYRKALEASNYTEDPLILKIDSNEDAQSQIKNLLKENSAIDGIIAADNVSGTIAINVATQLGIKIPEQISIIGFADQAISNLSVPKLSCINQNAEKIGKNAINTLVRRLNNKLESTEYTTEIIATQIVNNGSI